MPPQTKTGEWFSEVDLGKLFFFFLNFCRGLYFAINYEISICSLASNYINQMEQIQLGTIIIYIRIEVGYTWCVRFDIFHILWVVRGKEAKKRMHEKEIRKNEKETPCKLKNHIHERQVYNT